jgi:hypothetical protein
VVPSEGGRPGLVQQVGEHPPGHRAGLAAPLSLLCVREQAALDEGVDGHLA